MSIRYVEKMFSKP